jgi:uncharacterized damage-inducible protein DinB
MADDQSLIDEFKTYSQTKLNDSLVQIEKCLNLLTLEQIWHRPNEVSNAIGNLVIHLNGNVRQWIVNSLGGIPFDRDRPAEFAQRDPLPTRVIIGNLKDTLRQACHVIAELTERQLMEKVTVQKYKISGLAAVIHVVEHFSLHTGQIVYATKLLINQDLSLYDSQGQRLDGRNIGTP